MNNQISLSIIVFLCYPVGQIKGSEIGCFVDGECLKSDSVAVTQQNTSNECLDNCKNTKGCQEFTFYGDASICILYTECVELSDADCSDCVSGDVTCESLVCNEPGKVTEQNVNCYKPQVPGWS